MQVIPVLDVKDGIVVHARRGERATYQALHTRFALTPQPTAVVAGMLAAQPFASLYIADLDAIAGGGGNVDVIKQIAAQHPRLSVWLDAGFTSTAQLATFAAVDSVKYVLASESLDSLDHYRKLSATLAPARQILSLDRARDGMLGCSALFSAHELWPQHVIHMNLTRVGAEAGPDWRGLAALLALGSGRQIYAAGGVRDLADLHALAAMQVSGALVATALHAGRIDCASIAP